MSNTEHDRKIVLLTCLTIVVYTIPTFLKDFVVLFPIPFYSLVFFGISSYFSLKYFKKQRIESVLLSFSALCWLLSEPFIYSFLTFGIIESQSSIQIYHLIFYIVFLVSYTIFLTFLFHKEKTKFTLVFLGVALLFHAGSLIFKSDFLLFIPSFIFFLAHLLRKKENSFETCWIPIIQLMLFLQFTKGLSGLFMDIH
jgi:hypothetical protein